MRRLVESIPGRPSPNGILNSCATVEDATDPHELMGVEWVTFGCCPVQTWSNPCDDQSPGDESPGEPPRKEFCRPELEVADPVTVYAAIECGTVGMSYDAGRTKVLAALELGEQRALEQAFWQHTLVPRAVDLTPPEGPVGIAQGVAALEGCLAGVYGGVGVLHVPTSAAALLGCCNIVHRGPNGGLSTLAGNCVTISAGASVVNEGPDGMPAPPGSVWLAASGPVHVRRGPVDVIPDRAKGAVDIRYNTLRVLAERTFVPATTCHVCMILVSI